MVRAVQGGQIVRAKNAKRSSSFEPRACCKTWTRSIVPEYPQRTFSHIHTRKFEENPSGRGREERGERTARVVCINYNIEGGVGGEGAREQGGGRNVSFTGWVGREPRMAPDIRKPIVYGHCLQIRWV